MSLEMIAIETTTASRIVKNYFKAYGTGFGIHKETAFPDIKITNRRRYNTYRPPWESSDYALGYVGADKAEPSHTELKVRRLTQTLPL